MVKVNFILVLILKALLDVGCKQFTKYSILYQCCFYFCAHKLWDIIYISTELNYQLRLCFQIADLAAQTSRNGPVLQAIVIHINVERAENEICILALPLCPMCSKYFIEQLEIMKPTYIGTGSNCTKHCIGPLQTFFFKTIFLCVLVKKHFLREFAGDSKVKI